MIKLTQIIHKRRGPIVKFTCPHCESNDWYVLYSPSICYKCGKRLPDYSMLAKERLERVLWHFGYDTTRSIITL